MVLLTLNFSAHQHRHRSTFNFNRWSFTDQRQLLPLSISGWGLVFQVKHNVTSFMSRARHCEQPSERYVERRVISDVMSVSLKQDFDLNLIS